MTVLTALIALNVAVTLLGFRALRASGPAAERFLFIPAQVARGENVTGMLLAHFSHGSVMHLVFNMLALVSFGDGVLGVLGPERFLIVYVVAGLGSDLVVFVLRRNDPTYRCLGASGSVFGIVAAAVVLDPGTSIVMLFIPIPIPGPLFLLGYGVISVILIARRRRDGISHEGHLGGALLGLVMTALIAPHGLGPLVQWITRHLGG
jgi:membrane associated rhomboid family serine protease